MMLEGWDYKDHKYRDVAVDGGARLHVAVAHSYIGLSIDAKPYSADLPSGVTFYESDTGRLFIWDGSAWRLERIDQLSAQHLLGAVLLELRQIRGILEVITS